MLKTPQKMCNQQNYFKDDLSITRYNSPERFNPLTQEMELIDKIKTQGKLDALELNLQFETIAENSGI